MKTLAVVLVLLLVNAAPDSLEVNGNRIIKLDDNLDQIIASDAKAEKLADGFSDPEGPVWVRKGGYLLFSDIGDNVIREWNPKDRKITIYLDHCGYDSEDSKSALDRKVQVGPNGATLDKEGRVVYCARGDRQIVRVEMNGKRTILARQYEGNRLNCPNDIVVKSDDSVYFTDPYSAYFTDPRQNSPAKELSFNGVYLIRNGNLHLLVRDMAYPDGLAFAPGEKYLYINDAKRFLIMKYEVMPDDTIGNGEVFIDMSADKKTPGHPDGMKVDKQGDVFCTGPGGIWIVSPNGKHLGTIVTPEHVKNFGFGDADGKTLYMTSQTGLYSIRVKIPGIHP